MLDGPWPPTVRRAFFELAVEATRAQFDPCTQHEEFIEALWCQLDAGFGLTSDEPVADEAR